MEQLLAVIGVALMVYAFYKWATLNDNYWAERNVKFLKPSFLVGGTGGFWTNRYTVYDFMSMLYNSFPNDKVFGSFDIRTPFLFIRDPEILKQICVKDFDHFVDHRSLVDERSDVLFGNSLFMMHGDKWRDMRATLSPAFTGSKMRQMFELVGETAQDMSDYFKRKTEAGQEVHAEVKDLFSKYTNDVIATAAFGIKVNSFVDTDNEFFRTGKEMMNFKSLPAMGRLILSRISPRLMQLCGIQLFGAATAKFFKTMILETIDERTKRNIVRPDMINMMMQLKRGQMVDTSDIRKDDESTDGFSTVQESSVGKATVTRQWNDNEIVAQCFLFFVAGFETSSTVLTFAMYELARNADIQQRLYEEIKETDRKLGGAKLSYDELQKMRYMDQVISETLRMWPPAANTDRMCVKAYDYDDGNCRFRIEKGTSLWIPIYPLHHDPKYFPNPSKFDPERFSEANRDTISADAYLPFGIGPRNCIGSRFALMEVKAVIYYLLLNFNTVPNKDTQIPLKMVKLAGAVQAEKGVHLQFVQRK